MAYDPSFDDYLKMRQPLANLDEGDAVDIYHGYSYICGSPLKKSEQVIISRVTKTFIWIGDRKFHRVSGYLCKGVNGVEDSTRILPVGLEEQVETLNKHIVLTEKLGKVIWRQLPLSKLQQISDLLS